MEELLTELEIPYHIQGRDTRAGWLQCTCPQCGGLKYLGINIVGNYPHCWRCGPLKIAPVLQQLSNKSWRVVLELLNRLDRLPLPEIDIPKGKLVLPQGLGPLQPIHKHYLKERGLNPDELETKWGIRGIGLGTDLSWRIWIPIILHGKLVSWTTRAVGNTPTRYISAKRQEETIHHKYLLFGGDAIRHVAVVVEGPIDAMRIGFGAVCTFGIAYTHEQMERIAKIPVRIIAFDSEPKAQESARRLCKELSLFPGSTTNIVLNSKDPGCATETELELLRSYLL